jgi:hypothetical protein
VRQPPVLARLGLLMPPTVKYSRALGIHVSPTVLWDGIEQTQVSSSWGENEWTQFLEKNVAI